MESITHTCYDCGKETRNYYLCDGCRRVHKWKGESIEKLYQMEIDFWYASMLDNAIIKLEGK